MNCPQCEQTIAPDSFRIGPWADDMDLLTGEITGCHRALILRCDQCGMFQADEDARGFIRRTIKLSNLKDLRRLDKKLARRTEVAA